MTPSSRLYYYRARYYDPKIGRFLSEDPIPTRKRPLSELNGYAYVANNPVLFVDPYGLQAFPQNIRRSDIQHCLTDPAACQAKLDCYYRAERMVRHVFGGPDPDGTPANAFKHCFWACCTAKKVGCERAAEAVQAHEWIPNNPPPDFKMDMFNNLQGAGAADMLPGTGCRQICTSIPLQPVRLP